MMFGEATLSCVPSPNSLLQVIEVDKLFLFGNPMYGCQQFQTVASLETFNEAAHPSHALVGISIRLQNRVSVFDSPRHQLERLAKSVASVVVAGDEVSFHGVELMPQVSRHTARRCP